MGSGLNIWAFLVGLAAFAGWTLSRFTIPERVVWLSAFPAARLLLISRLSSTCASTLRSRSRRHLLRRTFDLCVCIGGQNGSFECNPQQ